MYLTSFVKWVLEQIVDLRIPLGVGVSLVRDNYNPLDTASLLK